MRALHVFAIAAALVGVALFSCVRDPASVGEGTGSLMVRFTFSPEPGSTTKMPRAPTLLTVDSLSVDVSGAGMTPIGVVVPVVDGTASGTVEGIPAGNDRTVTALAWSADPRVNLYEGADTVTISAGAVTEATLVMGRLQPGPVAVLDVEPDTVYVGDFVIADGSASYDCYAPDDSLSFMFLRNGVEIRGWSAVNRDTFPAPVKGDWDIGVVVRNLAGVQDSAECVLYVANTAPLEPFAPVPAVGDTVFSLVPFVAWTADDPDADALSFTVWFGSDSSAVEQMQPPAAFLTGSTDSLQLPRLQAETHYFWRVEASDGEAASASALWDFWTAAQVFTAEPESLQFPCGTDQHTVTLTASSAIPLGWTAVTQEPWLDVSPSEGTLGGTPQTVWVTIVSRAGYAPGTEWGSVVFEARGFTLPVAVAMEVAPALGGDLPDSVFLMAPAFEDTISFLNTGCGDLAWEVSSAAAWLTPSPSSGIVQEGGAGEFRVWADTTGLPPGVSATTVILNAAGMSSLVHVLIAVPGSACLDVEPDSVHIGAASSSTQCVVSNCGASPVNWNAAWDEAWITVDPSSGTLAPFEDQSVAVAVDISGLPSGVVDTGIWFQGGASPIRLVLTVVVPGEPILLVTPDQLYLPADVDSAGLTLGNDGTGILEWTVTASPAWSTVTPSSGVVGQGEQAYVVMAVNREGLAPGPQQGELVFGSNGGTESIPVAVDVGVPGCDTPIYGEDFNAGEATDWQPTSDGSWSVQSGRYVVESIPAGSTAWSQHAIEHEGACRGQVDVWMASPPGNDTVAWVWLVLGPGRTIPIEATPCDAISASLRPGGTVALEARVAATGVWFPCSESGQGAFFADGWNSLAVGVDETHLVGLINGEVVAEYPFAVQLRLPPLSAAALAARGNTAVGFDRVFVCPE